MSHFAVIAPPYPSHYQALQAVAGQLLERGHRVTFFHQADARQWLDDPRIGFCTLGAASHPPGSLQQALQLAARPHGPLRLRRLIRQLADTTAMLCRELPDALRTARVDVVLCDQIEVAGSLIGEALGLPRVSMACALPVNREAGLPLPVMPFGPGHNPRLYRGTEQVHDWLMRPLQRVIDEVCERHQLPGRQGLHGCLSPLAQISQTLEAFDFPRRQLPAYCHATGPWRRPTASADWVLSDSRPLVFASLGTLQGHRFGLFMRIARACRTLNVQLLLAHCGGLDADQQTQLRDNGATWVTDFAPQQWAVQAAQVVISHGGLNTVLDAVAAHTPLLVLPIAFDQPGVAARVAYHQLGGVLPRWASSRRIAAALRPLLAAPCVGTGNLDGALRQAGGAQRAADLIESAVVNGRLPVSHDLERF
ncbi:glycosyltransferase [Pseudomonas cremoricolorata]|uniref:Zeaxanthin glucosyltransferase n=1 Tax=Pseudomonas cremoricolorata TaxID=157783 RepID=A0A089YGP9_9PSED|nr:glycosyltransferase [Pseudomonas cremoricolorata]AIR90893.1 Zeaxanthin glucosyltransferase [Pseudomonas cremoricolorata]